MKKRFLLSVCLAALLSCQGNERATRVNDVSPATSNDVTAKAKPGGTGGGAVLVQLDSVSPSSIGIDGGVITLTGRFSGATKSLSITVGGVPVANIVSVSNTSIQAVAPRAMAFGPAQIVVTTHNGTVSADGLLSYLAPELVGYVTDDPLMGNNNSVVAVEMTPMGLVVVWKKCFLGDTYRFDLMDLTDPADPTIAVSYNNLPDAVAGGLFPASVLDWASANPGLMFPHVEPCTYPGCNKAIFDGAGDYPASGNIIVHGGLDVSCGNFDGETVINNFYYPYPEFDPALSPILDPLPPIDGDIEPIESLIDKENYFKENYFACMSNMMAIICDDNIVYANTLNLVTPFYMEASEYLASRESLFRSYCPNLKESNPYPTRVFDSGYQLFTRYSNRVLITDATNFNAPVLLSETFLPEPLIDYPEIVYRPKFNQDLDWPWGVVTTTTSDADFVRTSKVWPLDFSDPANPVVGAPWQPGVGTTVQNINLEPDGSWAWMSMQLYFSYPDMAYELYLFDWTNPMAPTPIGSILLGNPPSSVPSDLEVVGDYLYAAQGIDGLAIIRINR